MTFRHAWFGALLGATLLASCGGSSSSEQANPACPRVGIVTDLSRLTVFRAGAGRDLTDIAAQGGMELRGTKCLFARNAVDVDFDLAVVATLGPAGRTRVLDVDYFVAVVDPERNVTRHESFRVRLQFPEAQNRQLTVEPLSIRIPLPEKSRAPNYDVFVGFQLTDDQLVWNRAHRGG